jgi:hypothetical protein
MSGVFWMWLVLPMVWLGAASHRDELLFWVSRTGKLAQGYMWLSSDIRRLRAAKPSKNGRL